MGKTISKYKVGEELILVENPNKEKNKLKENSHLDYKESYATLTWAIKVIDTQFEGNSVTLTYRNVKGEINKAYATCKDSENFDEEKVLEKAILWAFQKEMVNLVAFRDFNLIR